METSENQRSATLSSRKEHLLQKVYEDDNDEVEEEEHLETRLNLGVNEDRFNVRDNPSFTVYDKDKKSPDCERYVYYIF